MLLCLFSPISASGGGGGIQGSDIPSLANDIFVRITDSHKYNIGLLGGKLLCFVYDYDIDIVVTRAARFGTVQIVREGGDPNIG